MSAKRFHVLQASNFDWVKLLYPWFYPLIKRIKRDLPRDHQPLAIAGLRCSSMNASWLIAEAA
jgi:hypothetical protein